MTAADLPPLGDLLAHHELLLAAIETPGFWNRELRSVLGERSVTGVLSQPVGTGQVASCVRVSFELDGDDRATTGSTDTPTPRSVVVKTASSDPVSRMTSAALRHAEIEVGFYSSMATDCAARTPLCHLAELSRDGDDFVLVLEDLAEHTQADQITGMSAQEVAWALDELAALHATWWGRMPSSTESFLVDRGDPAAHATLLTMLFEGFEQRYDRALGDEVIAVARRLVDAAGTYLVDRPGATAVVHGDFRPDNLLVRSPDPDAADLGAPVAVVDWQTVTVGPALADLSYFLGGALLPELRAAHESELLDRYRGRLAERGVDLPAAEIEQGYRRYALDGLVMAIGASQVVGRTDRGDAMFCAMAHRSARHALDAGAFELL